MLVTVERFLNHISVDSKTEHHPKIAVKKLCNSLYNSNLLINRKTSLFDIS